MMEVTAVTEEGIDLVEYLRKRGKMPDAHFLPGEMPVVMRVIMKAEAMEKTVAGYGECTPERVTQRKGYWTRTWDARVRTLALRIPKVREAGRIVNVSVAIAIAVNRDGRREILGLDIGTSEEHAFWLALLRSFLARRLLGVELVISDAHQGLKEAIALCFAGASWQRCWTYFMVNVLSRVPKRANAAVTTVVCTIYQQPTAE